MSGRNVSRSSCDLQRASMTILTCGMVKDREYGEAGPLLYRFQQAVSVESDFGTNGSDSRRIAETRKCAPCIAVALPGFFHAGKIAGRDGTFVYCFLCLRF